MAKNKAISARHTVVRPGDLPEHVKERARRLGATGRRGRITYYVVRFADEDHLRQFLEPDLGPAIADKVWPVGQRSRDYGVLSDIAELEGVGPTRRVPV